MKALGGGKQETASASGQRTEYFRNPLWIVLYNSLYIISVVELHGSWSKPSYLGHHKTAGKLWMLISAQR